MKQENIELSVKEASLLIGVTTRSILNYIKAKEITAIKVGKSWYIKEPSLMAFAKRYGLIGQEDTLNSTDTTPIEISKKIFPKDKKKYIINTLKLYEIASKAFSMPRWGELSSLDSLSPILHRILFLKIESLELIGAGYYSFETSEKRKLYSRSREKIGSMLALLYSDETLLAEWKEEITFIENQLLAAYSSLIRKMEKRIEKQ